MIPSAVNKWSKHILMGIPLLFLAPMVYFGSKASLCAYVMLWMAMYWLSAVLPLPVTSMMPLVLFPLLDILSTEETATAYFDEVGAMVFASVLFAVALEKTGLATRVALRMLYVVGASFSSLLFMFMVFTALLSMLFSNTATTAIVAPVVAALIEQMKCQTIIKRHLSTPTGSPRVSASRSVAEVYRKAEARLQASIIGLGDESLRELRREIMVSVAYASSIGGTGTLAGTPGNIIMKQLYKNRFPGAPSLTPATWMLANVPTMLACLLGAWLCSYRRLKHILCDKADYLKTTQEKTRREVERRNQELGRIGKPSASTTLLMVVLPLFVIPRTRQRSARYNPLRPYDPILSWHEISSMCHWNLMFLISGSLTFSKASRASGLSEVILHWLDNLEGLDQPLIVAILSLMAATVTEFFSNSAVASMLIPIVLETAVKFRMHPMSLAMPVTLSCSFSFMLPASTPPNALVYDMASMGVRDMIWPGFQLTVICVSITILLTSTLGHLVLDVGEFPEWAADNVTNISQLEV
ncbi:Na(+)/citrate cotransporter-like isoform X2 [Dermacentor albipictus]|uniref:Na(+)/citrate cotransporter-like isoform X2 n=1 Tax=Dermacentor albipictus TaxID=60249 RepID=UPI0031FE24D4